MDRVFTLYDPKTDSQRLFQGIELHQTSKFYHRLSGNFIDGSNEEVIAIVDEHAVIQGYEEGGVMVLEPTKMIMPHHRKQRSDKGKKRGPKKEKKNEKTET